MRLLTVRGDSRVAGLPEVSRPSLPRPPIFLRFLELVIVAYTAALIVVAITGGVHVGFVSMHGLAKPLLILAITLPLRLTLGGPYWLLDRAARAAAPVRDALRRGMNAPSAAAVLDAGFAMVATRLVSGLVGFVANVLFAPVQPRSTTLPFDAVKFAETFVAWDAGWYFDIAKRGYYYSPDSQSSIAFFPLYPMVMRALAWAFGGTDRAIWIAGISVSCTAFLLALVALHRFAERVLGSREAARRTVLYAAVFPFSLFMTRVYSESVFLLTSVMAVSSAWDRRWTSAGVWGALATLARPNGILIAIPLGLMAIADRPDVRTLAVRALWLLPVPAALLGFCVFAYTLSGNPMAWLSAQAQWGYFLWNPPWEQLLGLLGRLEKYGFYDYFFVSRRAPFYFFNGFAALAFLALTPAIFKRLGAAMGMYVLASLLIPLSSNSLEGIGRYAAVLFPGFMLLGSLESRRLHEAILISSALLLALFIVLFVTQHQIY